MGTNDETNPLLEMLDPKTPTQKVLSACTSSMAKLGTLALEIAVIGYIGAVVGIYLDNKTVAADCHTVQLAKIGDVFIQCTIVEPKKDPVTAPPR
jgi:hypothetical protein